MFVRTVEMLLDGTYFVLLISGQSGHGSLWRQDGSCKPAFREVAACSSDVLRCVNRADHLIRAHLSSNVYSSPNTLLECSL